jgi:tetratricopeptide (TPR) repeat protein
MQDLNLALADYDETILHDPDHADAWYNRGRIYTMEGRRLYNEYKHFYDYKEALRSFNEALRIVPDSADVLSCRADLYFFELDDSNLALKDYEAVLRLDPNDESAIKRIGFCYLENENKCNKVIEDLSRKINENPNDAEAWYHRSFFFSNIGQFSQGESDFNEAIKHELSNAQAYIIMGKFYQAYIIDISSNCKYNQMVERIYIEGLRRYPTSSELYAALGDLYQLMEKHEKAQDAFDKALKYCNINIKPTNEEKQNGNG